MGGKQRWMCFITVMMIFTGGVEMIHGVSRNGMRVGYLPKDDFYNLQVVVIGNGHIVDGSTSIGDGMIVYQLKPNEEKVFTIKANKNNRLKSILFNGKEIKNQVKRNRLTVITNKRDSKLIVTFENIIDDKENSTPVVNPEKPTPPYIVEKGKEKELISVVTKTIPLRGLKNGISDELLRSFIETDASYKILSHNIQAKPGIYEIVIQLNDRTIQTVQIEVVDDKKEKGGEVLDEGQCFIHWLILIVGTVFTGYMGFRILNNNKCIKNLKERINCFESWEEQDDKK